MDKKLEKVYLETQNHWKNTDAYSSDGYENFKTGRRKYLASRIVELNPKSVLEIGCFGGYNLREINNLNPDIKLTGFDINADALSYAKSKLPVINIVNGSIYELEKYFEENQFDIVFTAGVLIHIPCFTNKVETENVRNISSTISKISKYFVFHAEHHDGSNYKLPNKNMRYVHNFNELYSTSKNVEIENAPDASHGFEQIIKITL